MSEATNAGPAQSTVGVRELKNGLSSYLERVRSGEQITVTIHGAPVACLTAVSVATSRRQALIDEGIIIPAPNPTRSLPDRVEYSPGRPITEFAADQRR